MRRSINESFHRGREKKGRDPKFQKDQVSTKSFFTLFDQFCAALGFHFLPFIWKPASKDTFLHLSLIILLSSYRYAPSVLLNLNSQRASVDKIPSLPCPVLGHVALDPHKQTSYCITSPRCQHYITSSYWSNIPDPKKGKFGDKTSIFPHNM